MRLLYVGLVSDSANEGFQKVASELHRAAAERHEVMAVKSADLLSARVRDRVARFAPDVIHLFSSPALRALAITRFARRRSPRAKLVASVLHPHCMHLATPWGRAALSRVRPDVAFVQTHEAGRLFGQAGARVVRMAHGVREDDFAPVTRAQRRALKIELGADPDRPLILHVGHLTGRRRLERLLPLTGVGEVLVVSSPHFPEDASVRRELERGGIRVLRGHRPAIQRTYQAADCYVFPVDPADSIFQPLSVLEASACGLPVVCMLYPALAEWASEFPNVRHAGSPKEFRALVEDTIAQPPAEKASVPTWREVSTRIEEVYNECVE